MSVSHRALAAATSIVGVILWVVAVTIDAPLPAVIIPILMLMGGGLALAAATSGSNEIPAEKELEPGRSNEPSAR